MHVAPQSIGILTRFAYLSMALFGFLELGRHVLRVHIPPFSAAGFSATRTFLKMIDRFDAFPNEMHLLLKHLIHRESFTKLAFREPSFMTG